MFKKIMLLLAAVVLISACSSKVQKEEKMDKPLTAIVKTSKGDIEIKLYGENAPLTVANFVNLARRGFYDGIVFHRVIANFMIQTGDPLTLDPSKEKQWGTGGPGYSFEDEVKTGLSHSQAGTLSMANSGPNTNGSQIFITHVPTTYLDGKHTIFGQVTQGQQVVNDVRQGDKIITIVIEGKVPQIVKDKQARVDEWNKKLDNDLASRIPQLKLKPAVKL
jgi:peptidyl-prolyl cis-trans isomerase B (cyclophilin B)